MSRSPSSHSRRAEAQASSRDSSRMSTLSTDHITFSTSAAPALSRSQSASVSTQMALRGMRRLEARRTMEESHYMIQKSRVSISISPVDLRALDYVSKYDDNLVCPICRCPFVDPVILADCDHCYCRDCIRQTWTTITSNCNPLGLRGDCPTCRTPSKIGPRSATSKILVNILDELVVKCPKHEEGCKAEIKRGDVQNHVSIYCGRAMVRCSADGCELAVRRKDCDQGCLHYSVSCGSCRKEMHKADIEIHWETQCPDREIACQLCKHSVLYRGLEEHRLQSCPAISVSCSGAAFGCANRSKRAQAEVHAKSCALAKLAPVLLAQQQRMDDQEKAQKQLTRKLEVLETGFAAMQNILESTPDDPDNYSADESRIPFLLGHRISESAASVGTARLSPDDYDFPEPPFNRASDLSTASTALTMHTANMSPPRRTAPEPPGPRPDDIPEPFSQDFDLASPFPPPSADGPYASPLHHMLSMHENLREEMTRMSTALQELDGRHSMQILNENLRTREEIAYLGGQVAGMTRQVHWLTSAQLQRVQGRSGTPVQSMSGAGSSSGAEYVDASAGVDAAVGAVNTAATALRSAARVANVGREQPGHLRRRTSEEGRTKL